MKMKIDSNNNNHNNDTGNKNNINEINIRIFWNKSNKLYLINIKMGNNFPVAVGKESIDSASNDGFFVGNKRMI